MVYSSVAIDLVNAPLVCCARLEIVTTKLMVVTNAKLVQREFMMHFY